MVDWYSGEERQCVMHKECHPKCEYCGKFVSLKSQPHYLSDPVSGWDFEPPEPRLVCEGCYEKYGKAKGGL